MDDKTQKERLEQELKFLKESFEAEVISKEEFENKIKQGEFFEYVNYGGNLYGTFKKELQHSGDLLWRIDPSRAGKIKNVLPALVIYITCDDEIVLQRLKNRGLSDAEITSRMEDDRKIWLQYKDNYDYVVENVPGKLDQTIDKITNIIKNLPSN